MSAQQIPQNSTAMVTAPCLQLGTVTTSSGHFDGPSITVAEAVTTLPYTFTTPSGWTIVIDSAVTEESASFTVTVPLAAEITSGGGYNVSYYDASGNYYSQWFDVIAAGTEPVEPAIPQIMQGGTGTISIPLVSLTYKTKFISVDSPDAGTWLDDGNQALPYVAAFAQAPAPAGWGLTLTAYDAVTLTYTATVTVPASNGFGVYIVTLSNGAGHIFESEFEVIPAPPGVEPAPPCGCLNGFDIASEVQVRLRESQSTTAQQQSMLYLRHVRRILDEVARRTWCLYRNAVCDIIENQFEYVPPARPYEQRSVCVSDSIGNIRAIAALTPDQANQRYYNWQSAPNNATYQGVPRFYVEQGINSFILLPVPNYNYQNGLIIGGYYGVDNWFQMQDCIPLPDGYDEVVVCGVAWRRCIEMAPIDPLYAQMLPQYKKDYEELLDRHYMEEGRRIASRRGGLVPSKGKRISSWGTGGWGFYG